jgi:uncharacterized peroxidase-related enzyme
VTRIRSIPPNEADGALKELYDEQQTNAGFVSNYHQFLSLRPESARAYAELVKTFRPKMRLRRYELIMMAGARAIRCRYCLVVHGAILIKNGFSEEQIDAIIRDYHQADLTAQEVAIMAFTEKISSDAYHITDADFETLRSHDLSDEEILDIMLAAAARNFQSRLIVSSGIELEEPYHELEWRLRPALATLD